MATELVESPPDSMNWLERIIEKGVIDAASLEKLIALKQKMEDRLARQAFAVAMKQCQQQMPRVVKDTPGRNGKYTQLETLKDLCSPIWLKHGFSVSWSQGEAREGMTRVIATLYHTGGWFETYQGDYPIDGKGAQGKDVMNALQGTVSSHTYAQRDMIRMMFDVTIAGKDRDGDTGAIGEAEIKRINTLWDAAIEAGADLGDMDAWLKWLKVESLQELDSRRAEMFCRELESRHAKAKKARK